MPDPPGPWHVVRCPRCDRKLEELNGASRMRCRRCGAVVSAETDGDKLTVTLDADGPG